MAKSYYEIQMNFRNANQTADRLQTMSNKLKNLANERYYSSLRSISTSWKGENAERFLKKAEKVKNDMVRTSSDLTKAADAVRTIARNTYNAEMRAREIAMTRSK